MIRHKEKNQKCKPECIGKKMHVEEASTCVEPSSNQVPLVEGQLQREKSNVQMGKKKRLLKRIGGELLDVERTRAFNLVEVGQLLMDSKTTTFTFCPLIILHIRAVLAIVPPLHTTHISEGRGPYSCSKMVHNPRGSPLVATNGEVEWSASMHICFSKTNASVTLTRNSMG
eukprot:Gb_28221 [translate_table: standard]